MSKDVAYISSAPTLPGPRGATFIYLVVFLLLSACASRPYHYDTKPSLPVQSRAITQTQGSITVSASVPGKDESKAIFGIPIYDRGIQPVWLEIQNNSTERVRFAPTGMDHDYFSPLEVAYMHRKGFSKEARQQMDQHFYQSAMPRQIPAGETRAGYVFTHASPGTKSFNVDIYGSDYDHSFAFFITVPGFVPDHESVNFASLYDPSERQDYRGSDIRIGLEGLPWFSTDQSGENPGLPANIVIIAPGLDLLKTLLRAGWHESAKVTEVKKLADAQYLYGRVPDAVFRIKQQGGRDRSKLNLWLTPARIDGEAVWLAQFIHYIGNKTQLQQAIFGARIDPDIDDGRDYLMQNIWYSQSLEQVGWLAGNGAISVESAKFDFAGLEYFTDGYRAILWFSGKPVSLLETKNAGLDKPSFKQ